MPPRPEARPTTHGESRRVVVVDDNEDARTTFADFVASLGHDVRSASNGPDALDLVREFRPTAVLLDIGLPGMDGYEVARRLRLEHGPGLLVVAVTGYGREEDRRKAREAGFDLHLTKPVNLSIIGVILAEATLPA